MSFVNCSVPCQSLFCTYMMLTYILTYLQGLSCWNNAMYYYSYTVVFYSVMLNLVKCSLKEAPSPTPLLGDVFLLFLIVLKRRAM